MNYFRTSLIIIFFSALILNCSTNPFAPKLDTALGSESSLISDRSTIDGVFQNLQYAYTFKDTTIYGELLSNNFTFSFRDFDKEIDEAWGREDEMRVTHGLFSNTERLDLIWNNIVILSDDSTNVVRSFNLTITFNPTDVIFVDGKVDLSLEKNVKKNKWEIITWIDKSIF